MVQMEGQLDGSGWSMVERIGTQFVVDGSPFYVNGFNTYWLMVYAVDPSTRPTVISLFQEAASAGLTVGRTWAFNDGGWRALQTSPGVYDEQVFKALDFVIREAEKNKIRLILSLVNNWDDYGGKAQYVRWGRNAGLKLHSDCAFFWDPTIRSYFKAHIKAWIEEMALYVKSIDPNHLVGIGTEGFYGPCSPAKLQFNPYNCAHQEGTDYIRNHQAAGIDFASIHIYPSAWISESFCPSHLSFAKKWAMTHIEDSENILKMPVLFTEFGVPERDVKYRESFMQIVYNSVLGSAEKGGAGAGSLIWQLFPNCTQAKRMSDGFEIVLAHSPSITKIICEQSNKLNCINNRGMCLIQFDGVEESLAVGDAEAKAVSFK
ncbi:mannan endo-1,4-beta-mannosidase 6 isoform X2 [Cryptomeria japonica]|uniref:mannan endo-1,4-beta-mannosidase 6 isoform X2 n=1 Tax=Cryptomeria japonica TaxID=3369 RepID=UPI0027DA3249|nr:mannan endo-1,4-beta-mannosidase 6 isoform X2 [Cryptomeria japonica]